MKTEIMDSTADMTIGEIAKQTGLNASALRYYESVGVLSPPNRVSGQRRYDPSVIQQVQFVQTAQRVGFSISEMRILLDADKTELLHEELHALAHRKLQEVNALIAEAQRMKETLEAALTCHCQKLDECSLFTTEKEKR